MASAPNDKTKITRIKAGDTSTKEQPKESKLKLPKKQPKQPKTDKKPGLLGRITGYFKGSWQELKAVRWPDRKTTWKMTGALILFTVFFAAVILLLDYAFQSLFKLLLGK